MKIRDARLTPVAFEDPPLLNCMGVHEPFALRSVLELVCDDGVIGLGESYGDAAFLEQAEKAIRSLAGLDVFDLPAIRARVAAALGEVVVTDSHGLTGGYSLDKTLASVYSLCEVAALDAQGQRLGVPVVDLLGGRARDRVDFSAYLFYKYAEHADGTTDRWGEATTPEQLVAQARTMVEEYGFGSIKLKGGVFAPEVEAEAIEALADAFPDHPLRLDPNAAWQPGTSIDIAKRLDGVLEYLEDPTPGIDGMAEVARQASMPLATNMCVVGFADIAPAFRAGAVGVVLSDHHFWGGLRDTLALGTHVRRLRHRAVHALQQPSRHQPRGDGARRRSHATAHLRVRHPLALEDHRRRRARRTRVRRRRGRRPNLPGAGCAARPRRARSRARALRPLRTDQPRRRQLHASLRA